MTNVINMRGCPVYPIPLVTRQLHDEVLLVRGRGAEQVVYCGKIVGRTICPTFWERGRSAPGEYRYDVKAGDDLFANVAEWELSDVPWQRQDCGAA